MPLFGISDKTGTFDMDHAKIDFLADCAAELAKRADAMICDARKDGATADIERKWKIRGKTATGSRLEFSVPAFDYADAKKKAEQKKGGGTIADIVLMDAA